MKNLGFQAAIASSLMALLLVFSSQVFVGDRQSLTAQIDFCYSAMGVLCPCDDSKCLEDGDISSALCINEFTQDECDCSDTQCLEYNPNEPTYPSTDVCYNTYTQKECNCDDSQCLEYNPNETTTQPTIEVCYNQYTQKECTCTDTVCLEYDPNIDHSIIDDSIFDVPAICPFREKAGRTFIDFTRKGTYQLSDLPIRADLNYTHATQELTDTNITPGTYTIHLASYHHNDEYETETYKERWHLELFTADGSRIFKTNASRYKDANETYVEETVAFEVDIKEAVHKAVGVHEAYPDDTSHTFAPLCAAFDLIEELPESETVVTTTDTETVVEDSDSSQTYISPYMNTTMRCPLYKRENRIILDFTKNGTTPVSNLLLRADTSISAKKGPYSIHLPIGEYTVRLVSYGYTLNETDQAHQEWYLKLLNSNNTVITETPSSNDIPSYVTNDFAQIVTNSLIVKDTVSSVIAHHNRYEDSDPNTLAILCVAFDYNGELPKETSQTDVDVSIQADSDVETQTGDGTESFTRDIFSPYDSEESGVMKTTTSVVIPKEDERVIETTPYNIGLESTSEKVIVEEQIALVRTRFKNEHEDTPFNKLLTSTQHEREVLAKKLLAYDIDTEERKPETHYRLARESIETVDEIQQREIEEDERVAFESFRVKKRAELGDVTDSDGDGVTDYDEVHIYKTNPEDPFTSGSTLTDGERILLGLHPAENTSKPEPILSPKQFGEEVGELFTVHDIKLLKEDIGDESTSTNERIHIQGQTEPYAFVTLFVYSTPIIITVRSDGEGKFEYTFDETLENGDHELYVTSVNNTGKILAKSEPFPFVKTAQAIEYTPITAVHSADPVKSSMKTAITLLFILMLLLTISVVAWIGYMKSHHQNIAIKEVTQPINNEEKQST